jgi:hypothetical protein
MMQNATPDELKKICESLKKQNDECICELKKYAPEVAKRMKEKIDMLIEQCGAETEYTEVVINSCYGGFGLSPDALIYYGELTNKLPFSANDIPRHDKHLVQVVKELGDKANSCFARLEVVKIKGTLYQINEYDGAETVYTPSNHLWISSSTPSDSLPDIQDKDRYLHYWYCSGCGDCAYREDGPPLWHYNILQRENKSTVWFCSECKDLNKEGRIKRRKVIDQAFFRRRIEEDLIRDAAEEDEKTNAKRQRRECMPE